MALTNTDCIKALDKAINPFIHDVADATHTSGAPQAITAGVEYRFTIDAVARNFRQNPEHLADAGNGWDATNNKIAMPDVMNVQSVIGRINMVFDPASASEGKVVVRTYIDDATPKLINEEVSLYKSIPERVNLEISWYTGTETGYDAKSDGVYFTVEFDSNGDLYEKGFVFTLIT